MKGRIAVLGRLCGREAAALVVDGRLEDLLIEPPDDAPPGPGSVLRAIPDRPAKGQGGMFVKLPGGLSGFLRETEGVAPGRPLVVQVTGVSEPGKAVPVSRRVLLKGRTAIVTPGAPGLNISRRIRDGDDRARLEALLSGAEAGDGSGLILRTAAAEAAEADILAEVKTLRDLSSAVMADLAGGPELLLAAPDPHEEAWRDWTDPPVDAVEEGDGAFARLGVDDLVDAAVDPVVRLPGGAHMAVEATRALVAVDVNTGTDTSPAASLKANIAAARDLPRQLRIRGLGGQVTIDFAPMPKRDRPALEQQLRAAFRADAAEATLAGWTPLGNYELQRRRDRMPLALLLAGARKG